MALKRQAVRGLATALRNRKKTTGTSSTQNAFPIVLGGYPLKQLQLPKEFVVVPQKQSSAGTVVKPSNLAQVRAALRTRKLKLG